MTRLPHAARLPWTAILAGTLAAAAGGQDPAPKEVNQNLKGETVKVGDLSVTDLKVPADNLVPRVLWADPAGKAVILVEKSGLVRRVSVPVFEESLRVDLQRKCSGAALSAEGLVLALPNDQQVWVLDAERLTVKKKIAVSSVSDVAASPKVAVAVASGAKVLHTLELKKGKATSFQPAPQVKVKDYENPVMTDDGAFVLARGNNGNSILRFKLSKAGALSPDGMSEDIGSGAIYNGLQLSPDGKFVCLPSGGGNRPGLKGHPEVGTYTTYVYPVATLNKPAFVLESGAYPTAVGFDPAAKLVYAQNADFLLIAFSATGVKKKEFGIDTGERPVSVRQLLPHPDGGKLLVLTGRRLVWVELPKLE
jgi:hypothetical protein